MTWARQVNPSWRSRLLGEPLKASTGPRPFRAPPGKASSLVTLQRIGRSPKGGKSPPGEKRHQDTLAWACLSQPRFSLKGILKGHAKLNIPSVIRHRNEALRHWLRCLRPVTVAVTRTDRAPAADIAGIRAQANMAVWLVRLPSHIWPRPFIADRFLICLVTTSPALHGIGFKAGQSFTTSGSVPLQKRSWGPLRPSLYRFVPGLPIGYPAAATTSCPIQEKLLRATSIADATAVKNLLGGDSRGSTPDQCQVSQSHGLSRQ